MGFEFFPADSDAFGRKVNGNQMSGPGNEVFGPASGPRPDFEDATADGDMGFEDVFDEAVFPSLGTAPLFPAFGPVHFGPDPAVDGDGIRAGFVFTLEDVAAPDIRERV